MYTCAFSYPVWVVLCEVPPPLTGVHFVERRHAEASYLLPKIRTCFVPLRSCCVGVYIEVPAAGAGVTEPFGAHGAMTTVLFMGDPHCEDLHLIRKLLHDHCPHFTLRTAESVDAAMRLVHSIGVQSVACAIAKLGVHEDGSDDGVLFFEKVRWRRTH